MICAGKYVEYQRPAVLPMSNTFSSTTEARPGLRNEDPKVLEQRNQMMLREGGVWVGSCGVEAHSGVGRAVRETGEPFQ